jgi:hypothetical protein
MRVTPRNDGGGRHHSAPTHTNNQTRKPTTPADWKADTPKDTKPHSRIPVASFLQYPPAGRRTMWVQLVLNCVRCGQFHLHRTPHRYRGGIKTAGCGKRYVLRPAHTTRVPAQRNPEQLRLSEVSA